MSDPVKGSIASKLAEQVARAAVASKEYQAELGLAEDPGNRDDVLANILPGQQLIDIPLDLISSAAEGQARQDFNEERLKALADSLKRSGVREPIIVTPHGAEPGRFEIVAGERRWRAAQLAGLAEIPCIIDGKLVEKKDKLLAQAEENLHRENLNPVEEAAILVQLMEAREIDIREAGELMGKSYRQARRLQQVHAAPAPIKRTLGRGEIDLRMALELVRVFNAYTREDESPAQKVALRRIDALVERVVREEWSVKRLELYAARIVGGKGPATDEAPAATEQGTVQAVDGQRSGLRAEAPKGNPQRALVSRQEGVLLVDVDRVEHGALLPEERATLIALLEDLLTKTRHARIRL
jgi:ParB family transcriptional regulator, chromosome partitioning protein